MTCYKVACVSVSVILQHNGLFQCLWALRITCLPQNMFSGHYIVMSHCYRNCKIVFTKVVLHKETIGAQNHIKYKFLQIYFASQPILLQQHNLWQNFLRLLLFACSNLFAPTNYEKQMLLAFFFLFTIFQKAPFKFVQQLNGNTTNENPLKCVQMHLKAAWQAWKWSIMVGHFS